MQNKNFSYQRSLEMIAIGAPETISMKEKEKPDAVRTKVGETGRKDIEASRKPGSPWKPSILVDAAQKQKRRECVDQDVGGQGLPEGSSAWLSALVSETGNIPVFIKTGANYPIFML